MSDAVVKPPVEITPAASVAAGVSIGQIFLEFLIIGATSFGGVVPYLRSSLVTKRGWINDKEFAECRTSNTLASGTTRGLQLFELSVYLRCMQSPLQ